MSAWLCAYVHILRMAVAARQRIKSQYPAGKVSCKCTNVSSLGEGGGGGVMYLEENEVLVFCTTILIMVFFIKASSS